MSKIMFTLIGRNKQNIKTSTITTRLQDKETKCKNYILKHAFFLPMKNRDIEGYRSNGYKECILHRKQV